MKIRGPRTVALPNELEATELIKKMRKEIDGNENYRTKSLKIHGAICAKCGREFDLSSVHLLTVHHKDGNHQNNKPDGSNWENLCIHCHDDEHSRGLFGDYLTAKTEKV